MKHMLKGNSPDIFEKWVTGGNADWTPEFQNLRGDEKIALLDALMREQYWVCCYCGNLLSKEQAHIEHFRPQTKFPQLALSYENLLASCIRSTNKGDPLHCGHKKGEEYSDEFISPHDPNCEGRFIYTSGGAIMAQSPSDDSATMMIEVLGLDHIALNLRRKNVLQAVFGAEFMNGVSNSDLQKIRDAYRQPDMDGKLSSFGHVVAQFSEQYLSTPTSASLTAPAPSVHG